MMYLDLRILSKDNKVGFMKKKLTQEELTLLPSKRECQAVLGKEILYYRSTYKEPFKCFVA